jgi:hypothetical protein
MGENNINKIYLINGLFRINDINCMFFKREFPYENTLGLAPSDSGLKGLFSAVQPPCIT